jgi:hypothetical protein
MLARVVGARAPRKGDSRTKRSNFSASGPPRDTQHEAAARGMADQGQLRIRISLPQFGNQVGEVVVELIGISDVAARA